MNDLQAYFVNNNGRLLDKWLHYFEIYDRHFSRFRNKEVHVVEIGVSQGGSLDMWKHYFGPKSRIYGVDINPNCKTFEDSQIKIFIGNQGNRGFLKDLATKIPKIDILIDDGGHTMRQQKNTFKVLYPHIDRNGIYLCEDLHTSYWMRWGGGYRRPGTFIEFSKHFIDYINAWHSKSPLLKVSEFTKTTHSLHYYDSVLVIEKREMEPPHRQETGHRVISEPNYKPIVERIKNKLSFKVV